MPTADRAVCLSLPSSSKTEVALMTHSFAKWLQVLLSSHGKKQISHAAPDALQGKSYYSQVLQWAPETDEKWVYR